MPFRAKSKMSRHQCLRSAKRTLSQKPEVTVSQKPEVTVEGLTESLQAHRATINNLCDQIVTMDRQYKRKRDEAHAFEGRLDFKAMEFQTEMQVTKKMRVEKETAYEEDLKRMSELCNSQRTQISHLQTAIGRLMKVQTERTEQQSLWERRATALEEKLRQNQAEKEAQEKMWQRRIAALEQRLRHSQAEKEAQEMVWED